ncbi:MAG: hypothetical protein L0I76_03600 [Pseudonocardia sp.]|nr:hypothetical protein [Pseudonocardia sp.]
MSEVITPMARNASTTTLNSSTRRLRTIVISMSSSGPIPLRSNAVTWPYPRSVSRSKTTIGTTTLSRVVCTHGRTFAANPPPVAGRLEGWDSMASAMVTVLM